MYTCPLYFQFRTTKTTTCSSNVVLSFSLFACPEQGNLAKREHLLKEALLLSSMTHYNVLSLEAVCLDVRSDIWLVTDIPALGDLKAYLRNAAKVALNEMVSPKQCVEKQLVRLHLCMV